MEGQDLREQFEAIRRGLRRTGRQMVLMSTQAFLRGLFVLAGAAASLLLVSASGWCLLALWLGVIAVEGAIELALYLRLARQSPGSFVTGIEIQMLKLIAVLAGVGAVAAAALYHRGQAELIPPLWMLLIGASYVSVGLFSFSDTWILGVVVCAGGAAASFLPLPYSFIAAGLLLGLGSIVWSCILAARARRRG
jgi:hypothetical protein